MSKVIKARHDASAATSARVQVVIEELGYEASAMGLPIGTIRA